MTQDLATATPTVDEPATKERRLPVLKLAFAMIALQLVFRIWCIHSSGWVRDDFVLIDRAMQPDAMSLSWLFQGYDSHLIPGVLFLTSVLTKIAPYNFTAAAAVVLAMQALASLGMLRFLWVSFGRRLGILAPLAIYLVSPFAIPSAVWWTPGSHNFMIQAALAWGVAFQISYLRTRRWTYAVGAVLSVVVGLVFLEKALLVIGALAFVTVAYFTEGSARERLLQVWRNYRVSVWLNLVLGLGYIATYMHFALTFQPGEAAAGNAVGPMVDSMALRSWATGIFGGPLSWSDPLRPPVIATPSPFLVVVCLAALVLVVRELARSRTASLRSLWLPAYFLICDVLLVAAARGHYYGGIPGFEFRYIGELSMATAMCLALATMPIVGAVEQVRVKRPSPLLDDRRRATFACVVVAALALLSTARYVESWNTVVAPSKSFLDNLLTDAHRLPSGASVVDGSPPLTVALPFEGDLFSHMVRPVRSDLNFGDLSKAPLHVVDSAGHIRPATVNKLRWQTPPKDPACGYRVTTHPVKIPLNEPVVFPGLWVHVGYAATGDSAVRVSAGGASYRTSVSRGFHDLYFRAGDKNFHEIRVSGLLGDTHLCTNNVAVGQVVPLETP